MIQSKLIAETRIETPLLTPLFPDGFTFTINLQWVVLFILFAIAIKLALDYFGDK